jgi:hypothetical protein
MRIKPEFALSAGESLSQSQTRKSISIAPIRGGEQIAAPWRIWMQGDELYLANRETIQSIKVSLHAHGNWHVDSGHYRHQLGPALPLSLPGWFLAVQLSFCVGDNTIKPANLTPFKKSSLAVFVDTPVDKKLLVDVLLAPIGTTPSSPLPSEFDSPRVLHLIHRNGSVAIVTASTGEITGEDAVNMAEMRKFSITYDSPEDATAKFAEMFAVHRVKGGGNIIVIVPLGPESVVKKVQADGLRSDSDA